VVEVKGSARKPYQLKNTGGVYSCTCPAWRNQSVPIERRTCKHLIKVRGHAAEQARIGDPALAAPSRAAASDADKPPILLAHSWEAGQDPAGWWMSEKLDGVRAFWDGEAFLSRLGNRYLAPDWFTAGLPTTPLDGELWIARGAFQRTISVVRRHDAGEQWRQVRFLIFDAPAQEGGFEARLDWLKRTFGPGVAAYAAVVEHTPCAGLEHLRAELTRVEAAGGEGLMLRQPGSAYVEGRSSTLLKVKSFFDAEAKVVGYKAGAGRHKGRTGALLVVTPAGVEFAVGTGLSDRERESPPPVGSVITYRYQELTDGGVPRFPTYVAVRHDFEWPGDAPGDAPG
jgi:DNA ligase-1